MSPAEIRYWIKWLTKEGGWPTRCLSRTLGYHGDVSRKLRGSWITPEEQPRFTRQLDRIISGELVPVRVKSPARTGGYRWKWEVAIADHPVPLQTRARMAIDPKTFRIKWIQPRLRPDPVLPSFKMGIAKFTED